MRAQIGYVGKSPYIQGHLKLNTSVSWLRGFDTTIHFTKAVVILFPYILYCLSKSRLHWFNCKCVCQFKVYVYVLLWLVCKYRKHQDVCTSVWCSMYDFQDTLASVTKQQNHLYRWMLNSFQPDIYRPKCRKTYYIVRCQLCVLGIAAL